MKSITYETRYLKFEAIQRDDKYRRTNFIRIISKSSTIHDTIILEEIDVQRLNILLNKLKEL